MIKHRHLQYLAGPFQLLSELDVGLAGIQVTGRMVVGQDQGASACFQPGTEDQLGIRDSARYASGGNRYNADDPVGATLKLF